LESSKNHQEWSRIQITPIWTVFQDWQQANIHFTRRRKWFISVGFWAAGPLTTARVTMVTIVLFRIRMRYYRFQTQQFKWKSCFNWAPRHEGVLWEWTYSSTHSWPRHYTQMSQLLASAALPPGKETLVSTRLEGGWSPELVWTRWCRQKYTAPAGTRTPDHPAHSPALYQWPVGIRTLVLWSHLISEQLPKCVSLLL
jgi:hypothetical protein